MTSVSSAPQGTAFEEMMTLYRVCVHIQQGSKTLLGHAEEMAAIAINAAIAAARSKGNQRALGVLANEAARISQRISSQVSEIQGAASTLAKRGLFGVLKCREAQTMTVARRRIADGANADIVQAAICRNEEEVQRVLRDVEAMREAITEQWRAIDRQNARIIQIAAAFRIEATRDDSLGAYFTHIATLLNALNEQIKESSEQLRRLLDQFAAPSARARRPLADRSPVRLRP
ncbi:hypothetical protein J7643_04835 [bacterium]|nr:hypothetical protein [bacterium]